MIVIYSNRTDVYENLAAEDVLLDDDSLREPVVFVYRNRDAVVIGKNQNPWRECAVSRLDAMGAKFARRISGGGAVYHDEGNFNIACVVSRASYRREDMLNCFIDGLRRVGIPASIAATTSLAVNGKKFSGNAFCYRRDKVLHHGTLLWKADIEKMHACLRPDIEQMETRAVTSCPMSVMNLSELVSGKTIDDAIDAIIESLANKWGARKRAEYSPYTHPDYDQRVANLKSWAWCFGATPDFEILKYGKRLRIQNGLVFASNRRIPFSVHAGCS